EGDGGGAPGPVPDPAFLGRGHREVVFARRERFAQFDRPRAAGRRGFAFGDFGGAFEDVQDDRAVFGGRPGGFERRAAGTAFHHRREAEFGRFGVDLEAHFRALAFGVAEAALLSRERRVGVFARRQRGAQWRGRPQAAGSRRFRGGDFGRAEEHVDFD